MTEYFSVLGEGDVGAAVLLLEDGEEWRDEMVACSTLTGGVSTDVKTVELTDDSNATATIDILGADGAVLLPEAGAGAIKVDGSGSCRRAPSSRSTTSPRTPAPAATTTTTAAN